MWKATAPILLALSVAACIALPPGGGGGGGGGGEGGGGPAAPAPPQPAPLPESLSTTDQDGVLVAGTPGNGSGQVELCLTTVVGMWRKELRITGGATLSGEQGSYECVSLEPALVRFEMAKAKAFGVMTGVGYATLDLTGWGGGTVFVNWFAG